MLAIREKINMVVHADTNIACKHIEEGSVKMTDGNGNEAMFKGCDNDVSFARWLANNHMTKANVHHATMMLDGCGEGGGKRATTLIVFKNV